MADSASGFFIRKWYADVADATTGNLAICYHSDVRWRGLKLRFFNLLHFAGRATLRSTTSFRRRPAVAFDGATRLSLHGADLAGEWHTEQPAIRERLLETPAGYVQWDCWLPAARAEVAAPLLPHPLCGLGYAECLTVTIQPWQLPIDTLRWGRFRAEGHSVVWIQWRGPVPHTLVWHNGRRHPDADIADDALCFGAHRLLLADRAPLRAGPLIGTVFRRSPWLRALFPLRILRLDECKWQTRATLLADGQPVATGWAVHERVEWPAA